MSLAVNPLPGALGAEITGARLAKPADDAEFAALRQAVVDHLMVVVRDQALAPEDQIALSARFGALESHDNEQYLKDGHPEILVLSNKRVNGRLIGVPDAGDVWHSDLSFKPETAMITMLQSVALPSRGGDTEFANLHAAHDALPEATRRRIGGLRAVHSISKLRNPRAAISGRREGAAEFYARQDAEFPPASHPIVRTHPETGRKLLFVSSGFTKHFEDMTVEESRPLLDYLFRHQRRPEFSCRFRWRKDSIAFWDNRCTQHFAIADFHDGPDGQADLRRVMHRVTIDGDRPV